MKATITLTSQQLADQALKNLIALIQGNSQLQQHISSHGLWFEDLTTDTIAAFKQLLHTPDYSAYDSTDAMVHLLVTPSCRLG